MSASALEALIEVRSRITPMIARAKLWHLAIWLAVGLAVLVVNVDLLKHRARETAMRSVGQMSMPTALTYAILVQSEIETQRLVPFILANDPDVLSALVPGPAGAAGLQAARVALDQKFVRLREGTTAGVVYVLDRNGTCVAASNWNTPTSFVGVDYAFRPYFTGARDTGDAEYFASGTVSHLAGLFVSHRVLDHGRFAGVMVVKVQFQNLEATWTRLGANAANALVVDDHGVAIITNVEDWRFHALHPLPPVIRHNLEHSGQYGAATLEPLPFSWRDQNRLAAIGGHRYLAVATPIASTAWTLYLLVGLDPALQSAQQFAFVAGLLLTLLEMGAAVAIRLRIAHAVRTKKATEEMRRMAVTDALTQLPNRRAFETSLHALWQTGAPGAPLAALMIDVDHFKFYNDFYGHPAGDECLRVIAKILRQHARRAGDLAARYGGEEFTLLLPGTDLAHAMAAADAVQHAIRALKIPHESAPERGIVTVSIGVGVAQPSRERSPEALIAAADGALYDAKKRGRDCIACAEEG